MPFDITYYLVALVTFQAAQQRREDVHLHGLLAGTLGVPDALREVLQHLQPVLVGNSREDEPEQQH